MRLYERDYRKITEEEENIWQSINDGKHQDPTTGVLLRGYDNYPKAVRHYCRLFPNNYLDPYDIRSNVHDHEETLNRFISLFESENLTERNILNFIRDEKAYFILGSILTKNYRFGHHGIYLFREFPLGTSFKADYLIIGENSEGFHFVFVEFEAPFAQITKKNGNIGSSIRKGIEQVNDWDQWLEAYYSSLTELFSKHKNHTINLPDEFISLDKTRVNYVVVSGLRKNFNQATYRHRRKLLREQSILLLHYGNLIESSKYTISCRNY